MENSPRTSGGVKPRYDGGAARRFFVALGGPREGGPSLDTALQNAIRYQLGDFPRPSRMPFHLIFEKGPSRVLFFLNFFRGARCGGRSGPPGRCSGIAL